MKRSGGIAGRPMGHVSVEILEQYVAQSKTDNDELQQILAELGYRKTKRAMELKDLVIRLIDNNKRAKNVSIGPLFADR